MNILEVEKIHPCSLPRKVNKPPRRLKEEQGKEADEWSSTAEAVARGGAARAVKCKEVTINLLSE